MDYCYHEIGHILATLHYRKIYGTCIKKVSLENGCPCTESGILDNCPPFVYEHIFLGGDVFFQIKKNGSFSKIDFTNNEIVGDLRNYYRYTVGASNINEQQMYLFYQLHSDNINYSLKQFSNNIVKYKDDKSVKKLANLLYRRLFVGTPKEVTGMEIDDILHL